MPVTFLLAGRAPHRTRHILVPVPLRVLHCPTNVGNHPQGLARAERKLGLESWCVEIEGAWLEYEVDEIAALPGSSVVVAEVHRWRLLRRALRDYDVIHFNFGQSLLPPISRVRGGGIVHVLGRRYRQLVAMRDLPLLRRAGKVIAVTFQGDDARQGTGPDVTRAHRRLAREVKDYYTPPADELKRRVISTFDDHADLIFFVNPDLGDVLPERAQFVPYAHVDPREWTARGARELPSAPTIVHAPTHRDVKGTRYVIHAVAQLRSEGIAVELQLVEGLPHAEARRIYERADLLVDQLLVGWYGGVAVECMALGVPVVCFIDEEAARRHAPADLVRDLPIVRAAPVDLLSVLRDLLTTRRNGYAALCHRSRAFADGWHDPARIAARMSGEYERVAGG